MKERQVVEEGSVDDVWRNIAQDLGIHANIASDQAAPKVIVCVEGKNDVQFLKTISGLLASEGIFASDIFGSPDVITIPLGGSLLKDWVREDHLRRLNLPQVHIYDRDMPKQSGQYPYQEFVDLVNARGNGSVGFLTKKREMENYLHEDVLRKIFATHAEKAGNTFDTFRIEDSTDVANEVRNICGRDRFDRRPLKDLLNNDCASAMTVSQFRERGAIEEFVEWENAISRLLSKGA